MNHHLFNDRRKCLWKPLREPVKIRLGDVIKGDGYVKDIGTRGICVVSPDPFAYFRPEQADILLDKTMLVTIPRHSLTLKGTVVRINTRTNELAMVITHTSGNERWKTFSR
jgi:hypothetical protein